MFFTVLVLPRFLPRSIKTFQFFVKRIIRGVTGFFKHFPGYVFGRRFLFAHTRIVRALKLFMYYFLLPRALFSFPAARCFLLFKFSFARVR